MKVFQEAFAKTTSGQRLAFTLLFFVFLPQLTALAGDGGNLFPKEMSLTLRFMAVAAFFYSSLHIVLREVFRKGAGFLLKAGSPVVYFLYFLMVCWGLLSLRINHSQLHEFEKAGVFFVFMATILILLPTALRLIDKSSFLKSVSWGYVALSCGLILLALIWRLKGLNPNGRFGYPLSPGVFACYMMVSWAICYSILRQRFLTIFFFLMIVAAGSRSAMLITAFLFLIAQSQFSMSRAKDLLGSALILIVGLIVLYSINSDTFRPYTVERNEVFSGRSEVSQKTTRNLTRSDYLFGKGQEVSIVNKKGKPTGAHNSLLNLSFLYGGAFSFLAFCVWIVRFMPSGILVFFRDKPPLVLLQQQIFIMITLKSLIANVFWTNMADAATLMGCILLLLPRTEDEGAA